MTRRYRFRFTAAMMHGLPGLLCENVGGNSERNCYGHSSGCFHEYVAEIEAYDAKDAVTQIEVMFKNTSAVNRGANFRLEWVKPAPPLKVEEYEGVEGT